MSVGETRPGAAPSGATRPPRSRDRHVAFGLVAATMAWAFVVQSAFFAYSDNMQGDAAYHRGVALTMLGGNWQGEGPLPALLSFYGGVYPQLLALGTWITGRSVSSFLSVASWFWAFLLPLALWWLGTRIWPGRRFEAALFVFLGTVAGSFPVDPAVMWVNSPTLASSNLWPLYPRDLALVAVVCALAAAMGAPSRPRPIVTGAFLAVALCAQAQVAVVGVGAAAAWLLVDDRTARRARRLGDAFTCGATAAVLSAWWWLPRLLLAARSRPLMLDSFPGATAIRTSLLLAALGVTGIGAAIGAYVLVRRLDVDRRRRFFGWWLLVAALVSIGAALLPDLGLLTHRRSLLLASLPVVVVATIGFGWAITSIRAPVLKATVFAVVAGLALWSSVGEANRARFVAYRAWPDAPLRATYPPAQWDPVLDQLQRDVADRGHATVVAADSDAAYVWLNSGAQSFGPWTPTWVKLGFDPAKALPGDVSWPERRRAVVDAFARGRAGVCDLAVRADADRVLVRRDAQGHYAFHEYDAAALTEPDEVHAERIVGPGLTVVESASDVLVRMAPGANLAVPFRDANTVETVEVELADPTRRHMPRMQLQVGTRTLEPMTATRTERGWMLRFPLGEPTDATLSVRALDRALLLRVRGYSPEPDLARGADGPVLLPPGTVCPTG